MILHTACSINGAARVSRQYLPLDEISTLLSSISFVFSVTSSLYEIELHFYILYLLLVSKILSCKAPTPFIANFNVCNESG